MKKLKNVSRWLQAAFYVVAGANHFINPQFYLPMMPEFLPAPDLLHKLAGVLELIGGVGLLFPRYERRAAWLLIAILIAIFPANLSVALQNGAPMGISSAVAWIRLPFQLLFIAWAWWHTRQEKNS